MIYEGIRKGIFLERPNRFIAHVEIDGARCICHVKNTGRCKELLVPGATVYVQYCDAPARKTQWDLIAVQKGARLINMDAQAPNAVFREWLEAGGMGRVPSFIRPEVKKLQSRFDFYVELGTKQYFIEVKGVTLEEAGVVRFPDAPTERGVRHVQELVACKKEGYGCAVAFVVQMDGVRYFEPNDRTHPAFGQALREADRAGVEILALTCAVTEDSIQIIEPLEIRL